MKKQPFYLLLRSLLTLFLLHSVSFADVDAGGMDSGLEIKGNKVWQNYVQDFRNDHTFALVAGAARGNWYLTEFGSLDGRTYAVSGYFMKMQYTFHIPIWGAFGYFLGSSFGYYNEFVPEQGKEFIPAYSIHFPGIILGLAYNYSPEVRLLVGWDAYLERMERLMDVNDSPIHKINVTMFTFSDLFFATDLFFNLNWAIRLETHWRYSSFQQPLSSEGLIIGAKFHKEDHLYGLGLTYHLL